jgi:murein DD-endopeptidase MepM/ murein hydrolase activator NlpD
VVDHGYGLQSIYGHLREIDVKVGDVVQKGQKMGIEGETGLAGGVHLHFGMQVDGVQVNPREWWDAHWIHDRILSKLAPESVKAPHESKTEAAVAAPHKKAKRHKK